MGKAQPLAQFTHKIRMFNFYKFFNSCGVRLNYVNIAASINLHEFQLH